MDIDNGIIIYGAGKRCCNLIESLSETAIKIVSIFDIDKSKVGKRINGYEIRYIDDITQFAHYKCCISLFELSTRNSIKQKLIKEYGFQNDSFILYNTLIFLAVKSEENQTLSVANKNASGIDCSNSLYFGLLNGLILGGIEERVKQLCMAMIKKNHRDVFIVSNGEKDSYDVSDEILERVFYIDVEWGKEKKNVKKLIDFLWDRLPCTVITNQPDDLLLAAYYIKEKMPDGIRVISIISGSLDYIFDEYINLPMKSDLYIGVSVDIMNQMKKRGIKKVVSMKVPFPCEEILDRDYSYDMQEPLKIGYAGRLDGFENSQKRMDLLLKVFKDINEKGLRFIGNIAGEGPAEEKMKSIATNYGLDDKIVFHGRVPKNEIMSFWNKQDIGLNMADYEGRSISIAEMMGGGAVPIVTDTSGVREDIIEGENGFIVPLGEYRIVAERIDYLYHNRRMIGEMGQKAHESIFPKSKMDNHLEFWDTILGEL